jgi:hypothetical protein
VSSTRGINDNDRTTTTTERQQQQQRQQRQQQQHMSAITNIEEEQWKAVRGLLKEALLAGEITVETKEMGPKAVFERYHNTANNPLADIVYGEKFRRLLRSLRKKHRNGDLQTEGNLKAIEWSKSGAKHLLKSLFREGTICSNYQDAQECHLAKTKSKANSGRWK